MDDFERLQAALPDALAANATGLGRDHVVVAMPSFSLSESLLAHYGPRLPAMEHRYLNATLLLTRIDADVVFVCSAPSGRGAGLLRRAGAARRRAPDGRSHPPIALDDPTERAAGREAARPPGPARRDRATWSLGQRPLIEPWNVTEHEVAVALALGVPINGTAPALRREAFKSAGRQLFHGAGVPVRARPRGRPHRDDVAAARSGSAPHARRSGGRAQARRQRGRRRQRGGAPA